MVTDGVVTDWVVGEVREDEAVMDGPATFGASATGAATIVSLEIENLLADCDT